MFHRSNRISVFIGWLCGLLLSPALLAAEKRVAVETFYLNQYVAVLDGQWSGICVASDGNCYFGSSTHSHNHGAAFLRYSPPTKKVTVLCEDITTLCGEDPKNTPQGKLHSPIVECDGWLYFGTHLGTYREEAKNAYPGGHVLGYELASGKFRDFGVVRARHSNYSAMQVDRRRKRLYVFVTPFGDQEAKKDGSHLYRMDLASGRSKTWACSNPADPIT
jgi:hypothetical protein